MGDTTIPPVLYTIADLLPQLEGEDLESQLQTFDTFLTILSPEVRLSISNLLKGAAEPYDHSAAMKKYSEEHKKSFSDQKGHG